MMRWVNTPSINFISVILILIIEFEGDRPILGGIDLGVMVLTGGLLQCIVLINGMAEGSEREDLSMFYPQFP